MAQRGLLHDIEHGLATVDFLLDSVRTDPGVPAHLHAGIAKIDAQLAHLRDVLTPASRDPVVSETELSGVFERTAMLARERHRVHVRFAAVPVVEAAVDVGVLSRVVFNLVDNAAAATGPGGHVMLAASACAEGTVVDVTDDGPGFDPATAGLRSLGLRTVKHLLEQCGARLRFVPLPRGGTRASVLFPAAEVHRTGATTEQELG